MVTAIGIALGVLGIVVPIVISRRRRSPDRPNAGGLPNRHERVRPMRFWRERAFTQALDYLNDYHAALDKVSAASQVTPSVIRAWGMDLIVTAASRISRYSQGKASLFEVEEVMAAPFARTLDLTAPFFVGAFPLGQLKNSAWTPRTQKVPESSPTDRLSAAALAVLSNRIELQSLRDVKLGSEPEKQVGTTHILAIPLGPEFHNLREGDVAVVTIDLALPLRVRALRRLNLWGSERRMFERAGELRARAEEFIEAARVSAE